MKQIPLTQGKFAIVDDEDYDYLMQWKWQFTGGKYASRIHREKMGRGAYVERIIMHRLVNKTPDNLYTDHINGDKLDNRKKNLRSCTTSQNNTNRRAYGKSSKYKGVCWCKIKKMWRAQIGSGKTLGYRKNEIDAAKIYDRAASEKYGEFARINFQTGGQNGTHLV